jgi:transglutaminase-like putative cysteine protease
VRDNIRHSWDYQLNPVTCKASDVLQHRTGYCYAKSHLLAALLRASQIPAGLCYQRLSLNDDGEPYCLHGLNAVYLPDIGWYRIDARGNKEGVDARFCPPHEQLAFATDDINEIDFQEILVKPLQDVVDVLNSCETYLDVYNNLPDAESIA